MPIGRPKGSKNTKIPTSRRVNLDAAMELRLSGKTLQEIADEFKVTRQAIQQLIKQHDLLEQKLKDMIYQAIVKSSREKGRSE
jgi:orotate phosphoribosyltransferase-like protein